MIDVLCLLIAWFLFWYHGHCEGCGCPASVSAEFVGVEAAICGCHNDATDGRDEEMVTLSNVDGTYSVPFVSELTDGSGDVYCTYFLTVNLGFKWFDSIKWTSNDGSCTGSSSVNKASVNQGIEISLWKSSRKVRQIRFIDAISGAVVAYQSGTIAHPGTDLGTLISNINDCDQESGVVHGSDGGTCEIN